VYQAGFLESQCIPAARQLLLERLDQSILQTQVDAARMLGHIGDVSHIDVLKPLAKRSSDIELSDTALNAALSLCSSDRSRRHDTLQELSRQDSMVRSKALELLVQLNSDL